MAAIPSYARLEDLVLQLPREDRSKLASRLLESLEEDPEISLEWREEIKRRVKEIDEGTAKMIPAEQLWEEINQRFGTGI